ncbi:MAG: molecular chaperone DnaJ [Leptospiraceae bacterium]|nr:molecular chaperone DnaJ [Leptospiraceae bacterium]MCP5512353.1 molecular chaperone DnaJ [Leptospiraceae bacterium]
MRSNIQIDPDLARAHLREIISDIQASSDQCEWFIASDKLISVLNIRKEEYYRTLYSLRNSEFNPATYRGFHETDGFYLCRLLEILLKIEDIEGEFLRGGIFFSEPMLGKLRESTKTALNDWLLAHRLDRDLLILLASATLKFDDAFDTYLEDKFSMDTLLNRVIENFIELHTIEPYFGCEKYLKKYLRDQIQYKKISFVSILEEFKDRYYYEIYRKTRQKKSKKGKKLSREVIELLKFFELDESTNRKTLKVRYNELLKIYHPDINKSGLEKTKIIIQNYKKLHALLEH